MPTEGASTLRASRRAEKVRSGAEDRALGGEIRSGLPYPSDCLPFSRTGKGC